MKIDFHTHIFPRRIAATTLQDLSRASSMRFHTDGTMQSLALSMRKALIDFSFNMPVMTNTLQVDKVNEKLIRDRELLRENGIISFGGMHPDYVDYREKLRFLRREGVRGIKLHPAYQRCDLDDIRYMRIISFSCSLGLIVLTHAGLDIGIPGHNYASIGMALRLIDEVRPERLVLAHMGGWSDWEKVSEYLSGANVYFDTAFSIGPIDSIGEKRNNMDRYKFVSLCRKHGTDKILFGTDSPWADQSSYVEAIQEFPFTEEEREAIFARNAIELLGSD